MAFGRASVSHGESVCRSAECGLRSALEHPEEVSRLPGWGGGSHYPNQSPATPTPTGGSALLEARVIADVFVELFIAITK